MTYTLGIVAFALIIFVSVCLHEAGHMLTAKSFGMKVTRYFAGFGPTLWSFKRGETEYGVKAIPLGGFVKIVGMTPQDDDVAPEDEPRAMWRFPVWKRTIVMSAGSATHFVIGFLLLWFTASFVGLPNPSLTKYASDPNSAPAYISVQQCVVVDASVRDCAAGDPTSPAKAAGLLDGDKITAVDGAAVSNYRDLVDKIRQSASPDVTLTILRGNAAPSDVRVTLEPVTRPPFDDPTGPTSKTFALGISGSLPPGVPLNVTYGAIGGVGHAVSFTGNTFSQIGSALKNLPGRIPSLWSSLSGKPRDPNGPISVVGASELGGQTAKLGLWNFFLILAAGLNFFVGVFNLLPLLPLDGGHIAIAWYEKARSWFASRRKKPDPGRVDYFKLMPITYAVILVFGAFSVLTILADIVNPVSILQ
jgi:membrane-associated protease RseP (regulator of RpoE activity)